MLFAESYDRIFDFSGGQIGVVADVDVVCDVVELRDVSIYPIGEDFLDAGVAQVRSIYREIEEELRGLGFKGLRRTGERLTGASPGRKVFVDRRF